MFVIHDFCLDLLLCSQHEVLGIEGGFLIHPTPESEFGEKLGNSDPTTRFTPGDDGSSERRALSAQSVASSRVGRQVPNAHIRQLFRDKQFTSSKVALEWLLMYNQ
jgi:hypothetical protein